MNTQKQSAHDTMSGFVATFFEEVKKPWLGGNSISLWHRRHNATTRPKVPYTPKHNEFPDKLTNGPLVCEKKKGTTYEPYERGGGVDCVDGEDLKRKGTTMQRHGRKYVGDKTTVEISRAVGCLVCSTFQGCRR